MGRPAHDRHEVLPESESVSPRRPLAVAACLLALAAAAAGGASAAPGLIVGVDDDTVEWVRAPAPIVAIHHDLGLDAIRVTIPWRHGQQRPNRRTGTFLHRVALTIGLGQPVVLAVYGEARQAPVDEQSRSQYCAFVQHVVKRLPVRAVVIWNEANSARFWPAAAGAPAYEALLARCWDALHVLHRRTTIVSSTAAHHDAPAFIRSLGASYRSSLRARPLVDAFGHNPYPDTAAEA